MSYGLHHQKCSGVSVLSSLQHFARWSRLLVSDLADRARPRCPARRTPHQYPRQSKAAGSVPWHRALHRSGCAGCADSTYRRCNWLKNASAGRSKNTSAMLARRPPNWGPFVRHQTWVGLSAGVSELARAPLRVNALAACLISRSRWRRAPRPRPHRRGIPPSAAEPGRTRACPAYPFACQWRGMTFVRVSRLTSTTRLRSARQFMIKRTFVRSYVRSRRRSNISVRGGL